MKMDLMQVLMEEYKMLGQVGEKYFDRLYQSLYFTIVFYGAVLAVMKSEDNEKILVHYILLFFANRNLFIWTFLRI